jgi:hypothetical protein
METAMRRFTIVGALLLLFAATAHAGPILSGTINGQDFCATDNNSVCLFGTQLFDTDPLAGNLALNTAAIGGVTVNGSFHQQIIGPPQNVLNSSSLSIINNTAGTIIGQVSVGGINYVGPVTSVQSSGSGTWQNAAGSTIQMGWWADAANAQGGENPNDFPGTLLASCFDTAGAGTDAFSCNNNSPFADPNLFSMTEGFRVSLVAGGQLVSRGQDQIAAVTAVPEPATMLLMGTGLLAAFRARKRK